MTTPIQIQFEAATFTANNVTIALDDASIVLETNQSLSIDGSLPFTALTVSAGSIALYNAAAGEAADGSITIPVSAGPSAGYPSITVSNFAGTVVVCWPTADGPQYQTVMSGDPLTLAGFVD